MAGQGGKCGITRELLAIHDMECHHKKIKELGGTDNYENLMWLEQMSISIHATKPRNS